MDIKTFNSLATQLPPNIAVLMRGPTGVGKSHLVAAAAKELQLPFIDVRGSTMDESKVTGIPDFEVSKEQGVATFVLPSWFVRGCREPVVLCLDEFNRSMPQVQQAFFQVVLDRSLGNDANGNPMTLHPETRIFAAVNHGAEYDVNDMDPALLRRFWTVDLEPSTEDWISWASVSEIDPVTIDFIRQNPMHLRADVSAVEPGTVSPNPASWHRLDSSLRHMGLAPQEIAGSRHDGVYALAQGFVGIEAAISFVEFIAKYEKQISAEHILQGSVSKKDAKALKASESLTVIDKLIDHSSKNEWSNEDADNIVAFVRCLPDEQMVHLWNAVMATKNMGPIKQLHTRIGDEIVTLIRKARDLGNS